MERNVLYSSVYILRVWRDGDENGSSPWRISIEDAATGERHGFTRFVDLTGFFGEKIAASLPAKVEPVGR
ncbi:MAG: hypothetical protein RRC07_14340 [Anaerolineae bacterium]|nr:hypothetical protein [Anaerolineae bacterium]